MQTGHNKDNLSFVFWFLLLFCAFWKALKKRKRAKKVFVVLLMQYAQRLLSVCSWNFDAIEISSRYPVQVNTVYHFSEMAQSPAKQNEFKFCMSIKGLHPEKRRVAWIWHQAEGWASEARIKQWEWVGIESVCDEFDHHNHCECLRCLDIARLQHQRSRGRAWQYG